MDDLTLASWMSLHSASLSYLDLAELSSLANGTVGSWKRWHISSMCALYIEWCAPNLLSLLVAASTVAETRTLLNDSSQQIQKIVKCSCVSFVPTPDMMQDFSTWKSLLSRSKRRCNLFFQSCLNTHLDHHMTKTVFVTLKRETPTLCELGLLWNSCWDWCWCGLLLWVPVSRMILTVCDFVGLEMIKFTLSPLACQIYKAK